MERDRITELSTRVDQLRQEAESLNDELEKSEACLREAKVSGLSLCDAQSFLSRADIELRQLSDQLKEALGYD